MLCWRASQWQSVWSLMNNVWGGAERVLAVIGVYLIRSSDHPIVGDDTYLLWWFDIWLQQDNSVVHQPLQLGQEERLAEVWRWWERWWTDCCWGAPASHLNEIDSAGKVYLPRSDEQLAFREYFLIVNVDLQERGQTYSIWVRPGLVWNVLICWLH